VKRPRLIVAAFLLSVSTAAAGGAEPLPAPAHKDARLVHRVCESLVNGPQAGQARSLVCDLAGRPAVLVYAHEKEPSLLALLTKLDDLARQGQAQKMRSACVLLTADDAVKEAWAERRSRLTSPSTAGSISGATRAGPPACTRRRPSSSSSSTG
jgi:hypothetical protein